MPRLVLAPLGAFLRRGCLSGHCSLSPAGFRLFSLPFRGSFQLSLTVLVRYRTRDVFSLGGWCPPASRENSNPRYSGNPPYPQGLRLRGYHPLRRRIPADFGFTPRVLNGGVPATPHPPSLSGGCSVWALPLSVAPTHGIAFAFFSCGYSDVSFPRVPAPYRERPRRDRISHSGIPGSTAPCASPGLFAAWHALRRRPSPAIHRPG